MEPLLWDALNAIEDRDWESLGRVLHPYVRWTESGTRTRGRAKVLARLKSQPVAQQPREYEVRDGQIYRWTT